MLGNQNQIQYLTLCFNPEFCSDGSHVDDANM